jgi:hypothetical protein
LTTSHTTLRMSASVDRHSVEINRQSSTRNAIARAMQRLQLALSP